MNANAALTFASGAAQTWSTPPSGLGTLSFKTARRPVWVSGTPAGTLLYESIPGSSLKHAVDWRMTVSAGTWSGNIVWWSTGTGNLFGPSQTNVVSPSTPPPGTWSSFTTSPL